MQDFANSFALAGHLILSGDPELLAIVLLSLRVSLTAVLIAAAVGMPLGALLAEQIVRFTTVFWPCGNVAERFA